MKRDNNLVNQIEENLNNGSLNEGFVKELLSKYKSATYKEYSDRHKFYQDELSTMVNDTLFDASKTAHAMATDHPTLQQNYMRLVIAFINEMACKSYVDARNSASVNIAKKLNTVLVDEGVYLPYV